ncbi:MAG: hypothetical protein D6734_00050, partial [Candidatus Schekmanbacteria bacterium]
AKVMTAIDGSSNGVTLKDFDGPKKIKKTSRAKARGGSISIAQAKGRYTKSNITLGSEIKAKRTSGDKKPTHVRSGALFFGTARVVSDKLPDGSVIKDFKIGLKVDGSLKCKAKTKEEYFAISNVEAFVSMITNTVPTTLFSGSATVDGATGFDGGQGDFAGKFKGSKYKVKIRKKFPLNFGDVTVGKKFFLLFYGSTLVSFASDLKVYYCAADFYKTEKFIPIKKQNAKLTYQSAKNTTISFDPDPFDTTSPPTEFKVYIEDQDSTFLENIITETVKLLSRVGDFGSTSALSLEAVGDQDSDGIPDRAAIFRVSDVQYFLLNNLSSPKKWTLFLIGLSGETPFIAKDNITIKR